MTGIPYRAQLPEIVAKCLDLLIPSVKKDTLAAVTVADAADVTDWVDAPFAAGLFSGASGMTWGVTRAQIVLFTYRIIGHSMTVKLGVSASAVVAPVTPTLTLLIPAGKRAARNDFTGLCSYSDAGAAFATGHLLVSAGSNVIQIRKSDFVANWTATAANTVIYFTFEFQIE